MSDYDLLPCKCGGTGEIHKIYNGGLIAEVRCQRCGNVHRVFSSDIDRDSEDVVLEAISKWNGEMRKEMFSTIPNITKKQAEHKYIDENDSKIDLYESDPCFGCKFAIKVPYSNLDSYFSRRYCCINHNRMVNYMKEIVWRIEDGSITNLTDARDLLDKVIEMYNDFEKQGYCSCLESIIPSCYEKEEK